jgi:hypothetical protein
MSFHCALVGDKQSNTARSESLATGARCASSATRAQSVKDALAAKGVAGERLFPIAPRLGSEGAAPMAAARAVQKFERGQ